MSDRKKFFFARSDKDKAVSKYMCCDEKNIQTDVNIRKGIHQTLSCYCAAIAKHPFGLEGGALWTIVSPRRAGSCRKFSDSSKRFVVKWLAFSRAQEQKTITVRNKNLHVIILRQWKLYKIGKSKTRLLRLLPEEMTKKEPLLWYKPSWDRNLASHKCYKKYSVRRYYSLGWKNCRPERQHWSASRKHSFISPLYFTVSFWFNNERYLMKSVTLRSRISLWFLRRGHRTSMTRP